MAARINQAACPNEISPYRAAPHFTVDAATGALLPTSARIELGEYLLPIRVDEYRKLNNVWTKIGSVTRDQIYWLNRSTNSTPTITGLTVNSSTTTQPLEQIIKVNPGRTVALTLTASDTDTGQKLRFVSDVPTIVPGTAIQTLNATQARLTWAVPTNLPFGRYRLTVAVADDGCPLNASEVRTITFLVTDQVLATTTGRPLYLPASPNPFRSQVSFKLSTPQTVTITDGLGRLVEHVTSRTDGTVTWHPTSSVAPGMYFARSADGKQLVRLVRE
ncbi:T9SS type A sorting domain-containing protein [Hymenobacter fodinae]|nr:T9SS type A sorting domain-containing protein [Hymenobacter fodinae]